MKGLGQAMEKENTDKTHTHWDLKKITEELEPRRSELSAKKFRLTKSYTNGEKHIALSGESDS